MKENRVLGVLEVLRTAFSTAARGKSDITIIFTFSLRFDVYSTDYALKLKVMHALEKCQEEGLLSNSTVQAAKEYFKKNAENGVKVIYHCATDTDISVDREEVWIFHNFK